MKTNIENKDGTLSPYGFACGYMEVYGDWEDYDGVRLYAEGGYHVKGVVKVDGVKTHVWETFDYVKEARRFARKFGKLQKG